MEITVLSGPQISEGEQQEMKLWHYVGPDHGRPYRASYSLV